MGSVVVVGGGVAGLACAFRLRRAGHEVEVLERDAEGRGKRVEYRVAGLGHSIRYVLEYDYAEAPDAFSWELVEGDVLR